MIEDWIANWWQAVIRSQQVGRLLDFGVEQNGLYVVHAVGLVELLKPVQGLVLHAHAYTLKDRTQFFEVLFEIFWLLYGLFQFVG